MAWYEQARRADWRSPIDIKRNYASASFIANNRVVFNIKGNDFRLVVGVSYSTQALFIKFVGTHAEYEKINPSVIETR
jgi:mRNA interferase HigB